MHAEPFMPDLDPPCRLPEVIQTESELEDWLTRPSSALVQAIKNYSSPLVILGAGGKMGPTLAVLAVRAAALARHSIEVLAVSRFRDEQARSWLEARGVKTASVDLLEAGSLSQLPDSDNLIYLVGQKFGTGQNPSATWAVNTLVPARVCERYLGSRIIALSTGNVYPLSDLRHGGSIETDPLIPLGEYANAAVGRERVFEFYSRRQGTRIALLRLNYAVELRYGVLVDIALRVHAGQPIPLANGYFNCIWQGDANDMVLRSLPLAAAPPAVWNLCCPQTYSTRQIALRLGELMGRPVGFADTETNTALLSNAAKLCSVLGAPALDIDTLLRWIAHWVKQGGRLLDKPTHFEIRDGQY